MDESVDGCFDGGVDCAASGKLGLFVGLDDARNCGLRDGCMDGSVDGCFDGGVDGTADDCLDGCADGLAVQISTLVHEFLFASSHSKRLQQLNEVAPENIFPKSVPFDTSHCEMLLLNEVTS